MSRSKTPNLDINAAKIAATFRSDEQFDLQVLGALFLALVELRLHVSRDGVLVGETGPFKTQEAARKTFDCHPKQWAKVKRVLVERGTWTEEGEKITVANWRKYQPWIREKAPGGKPAEPSQSTPSVSSSPSLTSETTQNERIGRGWDGKEDIPTWALREGPRYYPDDGDKAPILAAFKLIMAPTILCDWHNNATTSDQLADVVDQHLGRHGAEPLLRAMTEVWLRNKTSVGSIRYFFNAWNKIGVKPSGGRQGPRRREKFTYERMTPAEKELEAQAIAAAKARTENG